MGLFELASATLRGGERRVEIAAQNAVNTETPGYKAQIAFAQVQSTLEPAKAGQTATPAIPMVSTHQTDVQAPISDTGNTLDLAINGTGYFLLRDGQEYTLTRNGQFGLDAAGALVDARGRILQLANGGDATTSNYQIEVLADGTMLDGSAPIGSIGIFEAGEAWSGQELSEAEIDELTPPDTSELRQGMLERSNVTLSDQMVELMQAQRQVESGAQLIRAYDQLLDRAISTFSGSS